MSSNTISTYLVRLVSVIFTILQRIIAQYYHRIQIMLSFFSKYWTDYSIFSSKISSTKSINDDCEHNDDYDHHISQSDKDKSCFDFEESEEICDSVTTNFNHILRIEQELNYPKKHATSLTSSMTSKGDQFLNTQNVFDEQFSFTSNNFNKKIYDQTIEQAHIQSRKNYLYGYISNTWLKLNEYNQINNEYLLKKGMLSSSNFNNIYPFTSVLSLPKLSKTTKSSIRGNKGGAKLNRPKLFKRKQSSFRPTELSTIFENLAY